MKITYIILAASLLAVACNNKKDTIQTTGNSDSTAAMTPATTSETNATVEENTIPKDSATLKAKEDSIIKEHGHKH
ncbi:MAG: hypothetical protein L0G39_20375 [Chryseobacterium sp.]|nr:hypothetical protein [Chryseobacterium sp.]